MMMTDTPHGPIRTPAFRGSARRSGATGSSPRSSCSGLNPDVARGVLSFLAATQATEPIDAQDAQPGKILHEMRGGEMAALGEVPFGRYYGSVDATPLFVMLAARVLRADRRPARSSIDLWPHVIAALDWMDAYGDLDGDGFIEYARRSETGLVQQGWKDSHDSVFHADGALADAADRAVRGPGLRLRGVDAARRALAAARGDDGARATSGRARAERLRARFEQAFWCEELGTYALALDGAEAPVPRARRRTPATACSPASCRPSAPSAVARHADGRRVVQRLGRAHGRRRRGALQPDVVPQRIGLAARQRADRRRPRALRLHGGSRR